MNVHLYQLMIHLLDALEPLKPLDLYHLRRPVAFISMKPYMAPAAEIDEIIQLVPEPVTL